MILIPKSEISICLPVYNESQVIYQVIKDIQHAGYDQVYVIDDGSTDESMAEAKRAGATVIRHLLNRGAGAAAQTSIALARKKQFKYLVMMDGDGQHSPADIQTLYTTLKNKGADIVIGSRFLNDNSEMPNIRKRYNQLANLITNLFCSNSYSDTQSGFRMFNRSAIEQLNLTLDGFSYCSEMLILSDRLGLKLEEAPIETLYSEYSLQKGQNFMAGVTTAWHLIRKIVFK